jgi:nucleoside phosphorylase
MATTRKPEILKPAAFAGQIDFGIVTFREDECQAVLERFPPKWLVQGERHYEVAPIKSRSKGILYVAVLRAIGPGSNEAQAATSDLIRDLDPACILAVGIAGAKPESEFSLGDVVLGTRVTDRGTRAVDHDGTETYYDGTQPAHKLIQNAISLPNAHSFLGQWNTDKAIGCPIPQTDLAEHNFYGEEAWKAKVKAALSFRFEGKNRARRPLATAAVIGTGDVLVKNAQLMATWLTHSRDLKAVEMELNGVFAAARSTKGDTPVLGIRGISDVVGFKRDPGWTSFACHSAASYARGFITGGLLDIPPKLKTPKAHHGVTGSDARPRANKSAEDPGARNRSPVASAVQQASGTKTIEATSKSRSSNGIANFCFRLQLHANVLELTLDQMLTTSRNTLDCQAIAQRDEEAVLFEGRARIAHEVWRIGQAKPITNPRKIKDQKPVRLQDINAALEQYHVSYSFPDSLGPEPLWDDHYFRWSTEKWGRVEAVLPRGKRFIVSQNGNEIEGTDIELEQGFRRWICIFHNTHKARSWFRWKIENE